MLLNKYTALLLVVLALLAACSTGSESAYRAEDGVKRSTAASSAGTSASSSASPTTSAANTVAATTRAVGSTSNALSTIEHNAIATPSPNTRNGR